MQQKREDTTRPPANELPTESTAWHSMQLQRDYINALIELHAIVGAVMEGLAPESTAPNGEFVDLDHALSKANTAERLFRKEAGR